MQSSNVILIGMPGAGKSTIGRQFAARSGRAFIDTDALIEFNTKRKLQSIVDEHGYLHLRALEEQCLLGIAVDNSVIGTGGSAIYSAAAMQHLDKLGLVIYLKWRFEIIEQRVKAQPQRGLAKPNQQSLYSLYQERAPLYELYSNATIACQNLSSSDICEQLESLIKKMHDGETDARGRYDR